MTTETAFLTYWRALNAALAARGKHPASAGMARAACRHMTAEDAAAVIPGRGEL